MDGVRTNNDILVILRATTFGAGLEPEALALLLAGSRRTAIAPGEPVFRYGERAEAAYLLLAGRVRVVATDRTGVETLLGYLEPGEVFGAVALFDSGRYSTTAVVTEAGEFLVIDGEALRVAVASSRQLAFNLLTGFGRQLKRVMNLHRGDRPAARIAVVRIRGAERIVDPLAQGIEGYGQTVHLVEAQADHPGPSVDLPPGHRLLVEWESDGPTTLESGTLAGFDRILWVVPAHTRATFAEAIRAAIARDPGLSDRARIVWELGPGEPVGPTYASSLGVRDFKVPAPDAASARARGRAVGRVVRDLLGLRRGLALSGGGAKGMAHLGVLRALDRAGIDFDLMAGTSGGALAGVPYAAGLDPDYCVESFARTLATPWLFRRLPRGKNLFLLWCFRAGRFDGMLRPYLHDWRLDQLPVPFATLTVDLVTGREVVREAGDAVHGILESINVPGVSRPIIRDDQALTDGGVLNNLPSDVLVARGAGFVVAVDVTRKMRAEFAGLSPGRTSERRPGSTETMFRVLEVLSSVTDASHSRAADLVIAPDTTSFKFSDFDRTAELAATGERAAEEALPRLREALAAYERRVLSG
jgi:predicted acylesterase/phospholipase RssA/CRP-like cAMP-binding protein